MGSYEQGTVLTCSHDGCGCRVRVETECHCAGATEPYRCSCGAEMVAVDAEG
ncbi:MAG: metallothionein [Actinobacteria bacterium]|nr:metallothionein [Actinomycetota bacterium]